MADHSITELRPYKKPVPLNVRVIRKYTLQWNPKDPKKRYYLLKDGHGNAIEARVETRSKKIDAQVSLYRCYKIDGYVVNPPMSFGKVVSQDTTIVIGDRTVFQHIPELPVPIPKQHFEFALHGALEDRVKKNPVLTGIALDRTSLNVFRIIYSLSDYLCRIESNSAVMKRKDKNLLKMMVTDLSEHTIEITLWEEMAYTYVNVLSPGKVIAVASLKVTRLTVAFVMCHITEKIQLESTPATTIDLELAIEGYAEEIKRLQMLPKRASCQYGYQTERDIRDNITTIADILSGEPVLVNNRRFACIARIKEIQGYRTWYSRKCPHCNDSVRPEEDDMICKHCGTVESTKYAYCVNAVLFDGTATLPVVFFDDAMRQLLGTDCETMVVREGFSDTKQVPGPMIELIGKEKLYSFIYRFNEDSTIQQTLEVQPLTSAPIAVPVTAKETSLPDSVKPTGPAAAPATPAAKNQKKHVRDLEGTDGPSTKKAKDKDE
ncbi:hypothetical protein SSX86_030270 [Deinandra increscens subsp. villosa]|uniref:Replication factor A C-terminal domain-containing protein n=1 Tax=Deinandra increscens subsp. villosa TaxID=3103831 RepID=A0AAP0GK98_9ASTR